MTTRMPVDLDPPPPPKPPDGQVPRVARIIDDLVEDCRTPDLVTAFYDPAEDFAGRTFLALAPNDPYAFAVPDLLAVTLLDVRFRPRAVRAMLPGGELADQIQQLLARIPIGVPLWQATDVHLGWAETLWKLLRADEALGVGTPEAGELLARKRPELIPVIDKVIAKKLKCASMTYWTTFREVLVCEDRRRRVSALRPGTSLLSVLNAVMWMHWSESAPAKRVRARLS